MNPFEELANLKSDPKRKEILEKKTQEFLKTTSKAEMDEFSKLYNYYTSRPKRAIYIDLPMLQDIYLGAILLMTQNSETAFAHIVEQMSKYSYRPFQEYARFFPELKLTDEEIISFIQDEKNTEKLLLFSPPTSMWEDIFNLHHLCIKENKAVEGIFDQIPYDEMRYVINTYPLPINLETAKLLKSKLQIGLRESKKIIFGYISKPWKELTPEIFENIDYVFSYTFVNWFNDEKSTAYQILNQGTLRLAHVLAYPFITDPDTIKRFDYLTQTQLNQIEAAGRLIGNFYCEMEFYRPQVTAFNKERMIQD